MSTVLFKAANTLEWPLLSCARCTCDIYAKFVLLLLKKEGVESLGCKFPGYMWGQFALDTNPSVEIQSVV